LYLIYFEFSLIYLFLWIQISLTVDFFWVLIAGEWYVVRCSLVALSMPSTAENDRDTGQRRSRQVRRRRRRQSVDVVVFEPNGDEVNFMCGLQAVGERSAASVCTYIHTYIYVSMHVCMCVCR